MAQLEKCMQSTKGLQIAGLSTIGLTAAGIAGNIYEATVITKNKNKLDSLDTNTESETKTTTPPNKDAKPITITQPKTTTKPNEDTNPITITQTKTTTSLNKDKKDIVITATTPTPKTVKQIVENDIATINSTTVQPGAKIYTHGYYVTQLSRELNYDIFIAMVDAFMEECLKLREQSGLEKIDAIQNPEYRDSSVKSLPKLKDDDILTDSTKHLFYTCE
jgi:hypothetical protein